MYYLQIIGIVIDVNPNEALANNRQKHINIKDLTQFFNSQHKVKRDMKIQTKQNQNFSSYIWNIISSKTTTWT
jgi:hypothetical protein